MWKISYKNIKIIYLYIKLYIYNYKYIERDTYRKMEREMERHRERETGRFVLGIGLCDYRGWEVQNLQCGPGGSRPRRANGARSSNPKVVCWKMFSLLREDCIFVPFRTSLDWIRPIYITESKLLHPTFTDLLTLINKC